LISLQKKKKNKNTFTELKTSVGLGDLNFAHFDGKKVNVLLSVDAGGVAWNRTRGGGVELPDSPLAFPHLAGEILQLLGLPVGVLDLVHLLEPISAASSRRSYHTKVII
jgi:hypothetical protein